MATAIVRLRVADFARWRRVFDGLAPARLEYGIVTASAHRDAGDPAEVVTILTAQTLGAARAWLGSAVLRSAMAEAGVIGAPEVQLLEDV